MPFSIAGTQRSSATPPPGTIPSSIAARVALSASSTRAFFSFSSTSVEAPTLMIATPPASLASRSCQPLLQLLAVVIGGGLLDLGANLVDAALDFAGLAGAVNDGGVVLVHL